MGARSEGLWGTAILRNFTTLAIYVQLTAYLICERVQSLGEGHQGKGSAPDGPLRAVATGPPVILRYLPSLRKRFKLEQATDEQCLTLSSLMVTISFLRHLPFVASA